MKVNLFIRKPFKLGNFSLEIFYSELFNELKNDIDISIIQLPFYNSGFLPRLFNMFFCYTKQTEVNHIVGDISYCAFFMNKNKLITTILDCGAIFLNKGIKRNILEYFLFEMPITRSKKVICISESTKSDLLNFNFKLNNKDVIIPATVSKSFFDNIKEKEVNFNSKFLVIGTAPNKNIERIAIALEGIDADLTIIGKLSESQKNQLITSNIKFKELNFALSENEVINEYLKSDILLFPSIFEGFGMPIIEANLLGVCVITSNLSSMPYVAGNSAELVDPFDINSIRNGILKVINNKPYMDSLILNGYKNAQKFNIKRIAVKHKEVYSQI